MQLECAFSVAGLRCQYIFLSDNSLSWQLTLIRGCQRRAGRLRSLPQVTYLLSLAQCSKARDTLSRTLLCVTGPDSIFSGLLLWFVIFFRGGLVPPSQLHRAPCTRCKLAAFIGTRAFSVSTQLTLMKLRYWTFSSASPFWPQLIFLFTSLRPGLCV